MKIDMGLIGASSVECGPIAADAERRGFDAVWASESVTDAFLQSQAALLSTSRLTVGTAIAVAFARNPMSTAYAAWDLAGMSQGRFVLGLGSQIQAHIERRFSMPWSAPAARMRDYLLALDAIFTSWREGTRLDYQGAVYQHTLMTPTFTPKHHDHRIPVMIAAVGERMTALGAELCDGLLLHGMTTSAYLDDVTLPAVERGLAASGRSRDAVELYVPLFLVMGDTEEQVAEVTRKTREQIAFYASTPAYSRVLDTVGYGDLQPELQALSRQGRWADMAHLIDDDLLDAIAVTGSPDDMPELCKARFGGRVDRISSYYGWPVDDPDRLAGILSRFHDDPTTDTEGA
ncbi:TIGR03617 family F420-dependent LLM class oxidoreductase [Microbacterium rhizomatis]|uniref:TIGR03617 family F420-dependent LLM class oxidoreductase n=1 Tax=Microbacterium rhizomatis TaxID=1631477 RepID=A0A5J5J0V0_9MICO|nr:TIGR03617 family F420-dependent LLM class oxidoreductase [Microbacterium rhizomatis]KAA9108212.1 TIGR03617 family F420-dependent LLM class oxidoreductase [Microbacterium rhizomatis]